MPRTFRALPDTGVFHILTRGNNHRKVFVDDKDYRFYLGLLKKYKLEHGFLLYHYCLMPNHVHLVLETTARTNLSLFIKQINLKYFYHFQKRYSYSGHLWQGRFKSLLIEKDKYLTACGRYIELNPVKANIVTSPEKYLYSSFRFYAYGASDSLVNTDPLCGTLGRTDEVRYLNYGMICKQSSRVNFHLRFFGSRKFVKEMERKFGISNLRGKRGRPRKANK